MRLSRLRRTVAFALVAAGCVISTACSGGGSNSSIPSYVPQTKNGSPKHTSTIQNTSTLDADILALKPTMFFKLDETSGTTVIDSSGNNHNLGVSTPTTITQGVPGIAADGGTAYTFTASNSALYGKVGGFAPGTPMTFLAFVNGVYSSSTIHTIACSYLYCIIAVNGHIGMVDADGRPPEFERVDTSITLTDNTPHMILFTVSKNEATCSLSIDGSPLTKFGTNCGSGRGEAAGFEIGALNFGYFPQAGFQGTIDDVAYWGGTTLTQTQLCTFANDGGLNNGTACPTPTPSPTPSASGAPDGTAYTLSSSPITGPNAGEIAKFVPGGYNGPPAATINNLPGATWDTGGYEATDSSGNLYVSYFGSGNTNSAPSYTAVTEYPAGATSSSTPIRVITPATSGVRYTGVAVDASGNIYVSDSTNAAIYVFAPTANGPATPIRTITGSAVTGVTKLNFDPSGNLWALTSSGLEEFAANANGNATPIGSFADAAWRTACDFNYTVRSFAIDKSGNLVIAWNFSGTPPNLTEYAAGFNDSTCTRINGFDTENQMMDLALDDQGFVYGVNWTPTTWTFEIYPLNATNGSNGSATPLYLAAGKTNGLYVPVGIAVATPSQTGPSPSPLPPAYIVASYGARPYGSNGVVSDPDQIDAFVSTSNGTVNAAYQLVDNRFDSPAGTFAIDGTLWIVNDTTSSISKSAIMQLPPLSSAYAGSVPSSLVTISGSSTQINYANQIQVDSNNNVYVLNLGSPEPAPGQTGVSILRFSAGSNGDVAPAGVIPAEAAASSTTLQEPSDIAVAGDGTLYVADRSSNPTANPQPAGDVAVFAPNATGDVSPIRTFSSSNMGYPSSVALDASGKVYVMTNDSWAAATQFQANGVPIPFVNPRILVFAAGASGNTAPIATITSSAFNSPLAMRVDGGGDIFVADYGGMTVSYFPAGSNGNVTPTRQFTDGNAQTGYGFVTLGL